MLHVSKIRLGLLLLLFVDIGQVDATECMNFVYINEVAKSRFISCRELAHLVGLNYTMLRSTLVQHVQHITLQ
jgi:hypothetical protein